MKRRLTLIIWIAGILLLLGIVIYYGAVTITTEVLSAGWGLLIVMAFHLLPMIADTLAWRCLLEPSGRPEFHKLLWMRWIGESVNSLLPAAQIGGDLVRGLLAAQRGVPREQAAASIIVDLTLSICTLIIFAGFGVFLALQTEARNSVSLVTGLFISIIIIFIFIVLQRWGLFQAFIRLFGSLLRHRDWNTAMNEAAIVDGEIERIYSRPGLLGTSSLWALLAWFLGAGEIWLAMYFIGHPVSVFEALMLESLTQAIRSAAFPVPGAWGVQEGGFVLAGMLTGIPAELAVAASLVKRVREIGLGVPGIIMWQLAEGRSWKSRSS